MSQMLDPMFYRSPADAIAVPPERLAYVAAFDPAGKVKDAMTVIDCDPSSPDYGKVVGWTELPTVPGWRRGPGPGAWRWVARDTRDAGQRRLRAGHTRVAAGTVPERAEEAQG